MPTAWLLAYVLLARLAIGNVESSCTTVVALNGKPAMNSVCAVFAQPSMFFSANSRLIWTVALACFLIAIPSMRMHLTLVPSAGWPDCHADPEAGSGTWLHCV